MLSLQKYPLWLKKNRRIGQLSLKNGEEVVLK